MWIITDEAMRDLLGGEFCQVVIAKQQNPELSMRKLFNYQFNYFSYAGFRKFFKGKLIKILNNIKFLDDDSILVKIIKFVLRIK